MPDTPSYTLESSDFASMIKAAATKAGNDINSIDAELENLTNKFKADIQSRQARRADLMLILNNGNALIAAIEKDGANIVEAIEAGLSHALANVGKDLNSFGEFLAGAKPKATQIVKAPPEGTITVETKK
jgi:hypothetical protein